jgi:hypothetical protein
MKVVLSLACILAFFTVQAQKPTDLDKSPMDMNYWPNNYPILKMNGKAKSMPVARVLYGRPMMNGRTIFGSILKYDDVWRLGANEATEIEFFTNVRIAGKLVAKGRYTMYCIPHETKWTLIINRDNYSWGHFKYDSKKDVLRKEVDLDKNNDTVEAFTMYFDDTRAGANLVLLWGDLKAVLPMSVAVAK